MECIDTCGTFTLKIHKDGTYEVEGITAEKFNAMFPNFSVSTDAENHFVLNNFYNATTSGEDATQMVLSGTIDAENVTSGVCTATQVTSWICSNGSLVANPMDDDTIVSGDYPTLAEVADSQACEVTNIRVPLSDSYNDQIVDAVDDGAFPLLEDITIELLEGNITAIELLAEHLRVIYDRGIDVEMIIPDMAKERFTRTRAFRVIRGITYIDLYPYYFTGDAYNNIANYVDALVRAVNMAHDTIHYDLVLHVHDYHVAQQFGEGVNRATEPMQNALSTLLKLADSGFSWNRISKIVTPYGWHEDAHWNFGRTFHYYNEETEKTVALADTYRPEYEVGVIAAVSKIVSSFLWREDTQDRIAHDVMSTLYGIGCVDLTDLNFFGNGLETDLNDYLELWGTFGIETDIDSFMVRSPREAFLSFANGSRDVNLIIENKDGSTTEKTYVMLDGISESGNATYMVELDPWRTKFTPSKITCQYSSVDDLGNIPVNGVEVILLDRLANHYADIETVMQFLNAGASSVTYKIDTGETITVTQNMMTSTGSSHRDILLFDKHDTENSTLEDGVLVVKNIDNMEVIKEVVEAKDIILVDLILLSASDAVTLMKFLNAIVPYEVNQSQVAVEWFAILKLMYALNYNIQCSDTIIGDVLYSAMNKDPSTYYDYKVMSNHIEKSPINGVAYRVGTPPYGIGEQYVTYLEYVRDNITAGYTSYLSYFTANTIALDDGTTHYINAKISGSITSTSAHTIDEVAHSDHNARFVVNGFEMSTDIQASFDACVDSLPTNALYSIARVDVSGGEYNITALSTIKAGWFTTSIWCPVEGCIDVVEGFGAVDIQNFNEPHVTYSFVTNTDESVTITYRAFDEDGNDITDDFDTISFEDKFLHKKIDGGNDGESI